MNEAIYFLSDYNWLRGVLLREGPKNYKIQDSEGYVRTVAKEKCALPNEEVCVVWELWRGRNGRGGYRVERKLYPETRVAAKRVAYQVGMGRIDEHEERKKNER